MSILWIITTLEQEIEIERGVNLKIQGDSIIPPREAIRTLDLIKYITKRSRNIDRDEVVVYIDNKIVIKDIYKPINKESDIIGEAGVMVAVIYKEIEKVTIYISIEYSNNKPQSDKTFLQQSGTILMKNEILNLKLREIYWNKVAQ